MLQCVKISQREMAVIVYTAKVCLDCGDPQPIRLIALSGEPGFGYETLTGDVLVKGGTMTEATRRLLARYRDLQEIDSKPYWQQTAPGA